MGTCIQCGFRSVPLGTQCTQCAYHAGEEPRPVVEPIARLHMTCCCCGDYAGLFLQHWNRDEGFGICPSCVVSVNPRTMTLPTVAEEVLDLYGAEGVNYTSDPVALERMSQERWASYIRDDKRGHDE